MGGFQASAGVAKRINCFCFGGNQNMYKLWVNLKKMFKQLGTFFKSFKKFFEIWRDVRKRE